MRSVTSFGPDGFRLYGQTFLESYVEHVDVPIDVYYENDKPDFDHPLVKFHDLFKVNGCLEFLEQCSFPAMRGELWADGKRNYRYDIFKFSRKSFAQIDAASRSPQKLYWIDADIEFKAPFQFPDMGDAFMVYLGRPEWHSCASLVGWNLHHPVAGEFFRRYWLLHMTGTVFCLPEWHDSFVLDWLRQQTGVPAINLAQGMDLKGPANVFDAVFGDVAHHKKGNLKHAAAAG